MNERIRELAEQAGMTDDKFGMFFAKDKHDEDGVDLEKFAELMLKASFDAVINDGRFHDAKGIIRAAKYTAMEHFGVEE